MQKTKKYIFTAAAFIGFFSLTNISYARPHDGPTSAPTANPPGGTYSESQTVTITPPGGALQTYYTLDGTEPNNYDNGTLLTDPIIILLEIGTTVVLKADSYIGDSTASPLMTEEYIFVSDDTDTETSEEEEENNHNKYHKLYRIYRNEFRNGTNKNRHSDIRKLKISNDAEFLRLKNIYDRYRYSGDAIRSNLPLKIQEDFKNYRGYHGYNKYLYYRDKAGR